MSMWVVLKKFKERLPSKEKFYSPLMGKEIRDKEYENVVKIWDRFERKTKKDYHDLWLTCDVSLVGDVFEKFSNSSLRNFGLCLCYYLSPPALGWDAMISMIKVELEIVSDGDMGLLFEKSMGGGVSYIFKGHSKVNNKYLKSYEPKQKWKQIIYFNSNSLYGYVLSKFLSTGGFKWLDPKQFDLNKYTSDS